MAMEYLGLSDINGPLVALDGVSGVGFEEMVRIQTAAGPRAGRVVALEGERAARASSAKIPPRASVWCSVPWA